MMRSFKCPLLFLSHFMLPLCLGVHPLFPGFVLSSFINIKSTGVGEAEKVACLHHILC